MTWLLAVLGRAALLGAVMVTVLAYLADPQYGWPTLLVLGLVLIYAGCLLATTRETAPELTPHNGGRSVMHMMMHVRTGALVTLLGRSALDPSVINYRDASGNAYAGFAEDYVECDDVAEQADALAAIAGDR